MYTGIIHSSSMHACIHTREKLFELNRTSDEGYGTVNELVSCIRIFECEVKSYD